MLNRDNNIVFFHWAGLILVVLGHQYVLVGQQAPAIFGVDCHGLGVRMLFFVSGFLVTYSCIKSKSILEFYKKRLNRIMPGLIICVMGMVIIIGPLFTKLPIVEYFKQSWIFALKNVFLNPHFQLADVFSDNPYQNVINGSLWTLPIEMMCYFMVPMIIGVYSAIKKAKKVFGVVFLVGLTALLYAWFVLVEFGTISDSFVCWGTDWIGSIRVVFYFFLGLCAAILHLDKHSDIICAIALLLIYLGVPYNLGVIIRPFVISYFVLAVSMTKQSIVSRFLEQFNYYYVGYLWAFPIQQIVINIIIVRCKVYFSPAIMFLISLLFLLIVSVFFYDFVEKKIVNVKKKERTSSVTAGN